MFDAAEKKIESVIAHEKEVITKFVSKAENPSAPKSVSTPKDAAPVKVSDIPVLVELADLVIAVGLVTVLLIKDHIHEGKKLLAGAELQVDEATARWLVLMQTAVKKI